MSSYTNCFINFSSIEGIAKFQEQQNIDLGNVFRVFYGWSMLPWAMLGAVMKTVFVICCCKEIKSCRVPRKCYVLFVNCAIGDIVSCTTALVISFYVLLIKDIERNIVSGIEGFFVGSFWSSMVSYCSLSVLKLFAVWKPVQYRKWFSMRGCIQLIISSWVIFAIIATITLSISALVNFPMLNEWSGCRAETCSRLMYRVRSLLTAVTYFFTLFVFAVTVWFVKRARNIANFVIRGGAKSRMLRFPLWKLSLNVSTFAVLKLPYVLWCLFILVNPNTCFFLHNQVDMMRILGVVRVILIIKCVIDPILSFITDPQLRRALVTTFCCSKRLQEAGKKPKLGVRKVTPSLQSNATRDPTIIFSSNSIRLQN